MSFLACESNSEPVSVLVVSSHDRETVLPTVISDGGFHHLFVRLLGRETELALGVGFWPLAKLIG